MEVNNTTCVDGVDAHKEQGDYPMNNGVKLSMLINVL